MPDDELRLENQRLRDHDSMNRLEVQRLRDRIDVLEGMLRTMKVGITGSLDAMVQWMESTKLPPREGD